MIEYGKLSWLDNDFITLWSDFILNGPNDKFRENLTKLAELGQINAIQSWLLIKGEKEKNPLIDEQIEKIGNSGCLNFNEMIVVAHSYYQKEKCSIKEQLDSFYKQANYIDENWKWNWDQKTINREEHKLQDIKKELLQFNSVWWIHNAIIVMTKIPGYYQDPFLMERCAELAKGSPAGLFFGNQYNARVKSFKSLKKLFKQNPNDVRINYHLGKNLVFWQENKKAQSLGIEILSRLASRPLSFIVEKNKEDTISK